MRFIVFDNFPDEETKRKIEYLKTKGEVIVFSSFDHINKIEKDDVVIISDRWFCGYCGPWVPSNKEIFQIMGKIQETNRVLLERFDSAIIVSDETIERMNRYESVTSLIGCWPIKKYWEKEER